jgi:hypothetical protein
MTQSEETPAEPIPAQPVQPTEATEVIQTSEATEVIQTAAATEVIQTAAATEVIQTAETVQTTQPTPVLDSAAVPAVPVVPAPGPEQFAAPPLIPGQPVVPVPSPEELAAAAAKKAKRRTIFAKSAVLALPAIALVALLVGAGTEASSLSTKNTAASTAAKAANATSGLAAQLHAAQSAADASILVDPGCEAAESKTTLTVMNKFYTDSNTLDKAEAGTDYNAVLSAANTWINDMQTLSTDLQGDAALSSRTSVKSAIGAITGDLGVVISSMQSAISGNFTTSTNNSFIAAANRIDAETTAADTLCGGTTLSSGSTSSSSGSGSGTTSA